MHGEILYYDETQGFGVIAGADGNRYAFGREDLRREMPLAKGDQVEFQSAGGQARNIFTVRPQIGAAETAKLPEPAQPRSETTSETPQSTGLWSYFWRGLTSNYANFRGRARRKEYWGYYLFSTLIALTLVGIGLAIDVASGNLGNDKVAPFASVGLVVLYAVATFIPALAMAIRRQHDIGISGWFYLLVFVPYIGSIILLVFGLIPTQMHENKWGPIPAGLT